MGDAVVAGGVEAAACDERREDALELAVDGVGAGGEDALVDAAGEDEPRVLLGDPYHVAAGGDLERLHRVEAAGQVLGEQAVGVAVRIHLDVEPLRLAVAQGLHEADVVGGEELAEHRRRDQRPRLVADVLGQEQAEDRGAPLHPGQRREHQVEPLAHALVHQVGRVVEGEEQLLRAEEVAEVHVAADHVARQQPLARLDEPSGLGHLRREVCPPLRRLGVEPPAHVALPVGAALHHVLQVGRHEAVGHARDDPLDLAARVLDDLRLAVVLEHLVLVGGAERAVAPAQVHRLPHPWIGVEAEDIPLPPVLGHPLPEPPLDGLRPEVELAAEQMVHRPQLIRRPDAFDRVHSRLPWLARGGGGRRVLARICCLTASVQR